MNKYLSFVLLLFLTACEPTEIVIEKDLYCQTVIKMWVEPTDDYTRENMLAYFSIQTDEGVWISPLLEKNKWGKYKGQPNILQGSDITLTFSGSGNDCLNFDIYIEFPGDPHIWPVSVEMGAESKTITLVKTDGCALTPYKKWKSDFVKCLNP